VAIFLLSWGNVVAGGRQDRYQAVSAMGGIDASTKWPQRERCYFVTVWAHSSHVNVAENSFRTIGEATDTKLGTEFNKSFQKTPHGSPFSRDFFAFLPALQAGCRGFDSLIAHSAGSARNEFCLEFAVVTIAPRLSGKPLLGTEG